MMNQNLKKEILKTIEISKEAAKNNLDITLECYIEILSRLEMLTYLLMTEVKKIMILCNKNTFNSCRHSGNFFIKFTS